MNSFASAQAKVSDASISEPDAPHAIVFGSNGDLVQAAIAPFGRHDKATLGTKGEGCIPPLWRDGRKYRNDASMAVQQHLLHCGGCGKIPLKGEGAIGKTAVLMGSGLVPIEMESVSTASHTADAISSEVPL